MPAKKAQAKTQAKAKKEEQPVVTEQPIVESQPEYLGDGMSRPEPKVDLDDIIAANPTPTKQGKWIKVTLEERAAYEAKGLLVGFDPSTNEAKIKENN